MATIRDQIVDAVITALNTGTPVGVPTAERERSIKVGESLSSALAVYPIRDFSEPIGGHRGAAEEHRLTLLVDAWAKGTAAVRPSAAVDPLLAWITAALGNSRLGGLAIDTTPGEITFTYEQGEQPWVRASQEVEVRYQQLTTNAEAQE